MDDLIVPSNPLKRVENSGFFYVKERENGQGRRWDPRKSGKISKYLSSQLILDVLDPS